jgi:tRNA U34 2-thiouridine synthase MnmA/TrmU
VVAIEGDDVVVGDEADLLTGQVRLTGMSWVDGPVEGTVLVQCSAHGPVRAGTVAGATVHFDEPGRRVAPGQSVALYRDDEVLGGGVAS